MTDYKGKIIIVTGAASGIGAAVARRLNAGGAAVCVSDLHQDATERYITPFAAVCLAVLMLGAVQTHRRFHESFVPALVLVLVCVAIAVGRFQFGA